MRNTSPQVDAYIAKAAAFAQPILKRIRKAFHQACPEIQETIKWGFPHFEYKGIVGSMAAFKNHAGFGFWKGALMPDPHHLFDRVGKTSMNAAKLTDARQLPDTKILLEYIRIAVALNEEGVKPPKPAKKPKVKKALDVPDDLASALRMNPRAQATFDGFSPSHRREYIEWITEAKQEATRAKRLATTIDWLTDGKARHWKHQGKRSGAELQP